MTMSSSVSKVTLNGDGVQTSWPFSFKVWKADDLEVILTSPEGTESVTTDWSVVLAGIGGTLTYPVLGYPLPTGWKITIRRSMGFLQEVDLVSGTRWDPEVVETALDQAAAERQQLLEEVRRSVKIGVASTENPANVVNQVFGARDAAVSAALVAEASANLVGPLLGPEGSSLVGFVQDGTGSVATTLQEKARWTVSVFDFMTSAQIADVVARTALVDCTSAIQTAITRTRGAARGMTLYFPGGTYLVSGLTVYYDSHLEFGPAAMLKMSGDGICMKTRYGTSDTYVTQNVRRLTLDNVQIDMDSKTGFGLLLEGVTHARVVNPRIMNVGSGLYTYNDGVAEDPYNSAGIMLKGVHGVRGAYYNRIINPRIESLTALENNGIYLGTTASQDEQRANFNRLEQPVCQGLENGISVNLGGDNIISQPELSLCTVGIRVGRLGGSPAARRTQIILPYLESCTTAGILLLSSALDTTIDGIASTSGTMTPVSDSGVNTAIYAANSDSITTDGHARFYGDSIRFPPVVADTDKDTSANALDDYQEGTFTPVIEGTTSTGVGTYSVQDGRYTVIGNRCLFNLYLIWSAHTGTGNMRITGLPFKAESGNNLSPIAVYLKGITLTANHVLQGYVASNQARIDLFSYGVGTGVAGDVALDTAGTLVISGQYIVNH